MTASSGHTNTQECVDVLVDIFINSIYYIIRRELYYVGLAACDGPCLGSWLESAPNHVMRDGEGLIFRDPPGCRRGRDRHCHHILEASDHFHVEK